MRKICLLFAALAGLNSCMDNATEQKEDDKAPLAINALSDSEKKEGWQLLFDGTTTKGWHRYGDSIVRSAWKIDSGTLRLQKGEMENWQTKGGGDIMTDEEYENFHLKLEWKVDTCGNSGIIFLSHEDTTKYKFSWETGLEMQVLDNKCHPDTAYPTHKAGCLYDLVEVSKPTVKPAPEWNQAEIKHMNGKLDFWLNGEQVVSTVIGDENWQSLLKKSKWKDYPGFGTYKKGKLGLQDHGNNVWYRNIKIKKL